MDVPVVSLVDVCATYEGERRATVSGISLAVQAGIQLALIGPNGAGKTTVLEVINGLLPVTAGSVHVFGQPVDRTSHRVRAQVAYMPQSQFFPPDTPFLVEDTVLAARFGKLGAWRFPGRDDRAIVRDALTSVDMQSMARRPVGRLSGGQQRKVLLARALSQEARLLLLDEPTANLDPEAKEDVAHLVDTVRCELDATSVVVTHEQGPLLTASDRIASMQAGRIKTVTSRPPVPLPI